MLRELRIENLAIIDKLELEFHENFVILTGETGAGKSIILDGINLLIGEKAQDSMIRHGEESLFAEGIFEINDNKKIELRELGIDIDDDEIVVRRELSREGRGKAYLNGKRVPVSVLKELMENVVDLVGQHSHQMLLNKKNHLNLVDKFLDEESQNLKIKISDLNKEYNELKKKLKKANEIKKEYEEKKSLYEYQLEEIETAKLKADEDTELEEEYKVLFNSGKIRDKLNESYYLLKGSESSIMSKLGTIKNSLFSISSYSHEFKEIMEKLDNVYYETEEISYAVENNLDGVETDEGRLNKVVDRLDKINVLKKKYGISIKEIFEYRDEIQKKLNYLDDENTEIEFIKEKIFSLKEEYVEKSEILSIKRRKISKEIEYNLVEELKELNMKGIHFEIDFKIKDEISKDGKDQIEFLISTNVGEELKPLEKIVSGGEASRVMLALKSIFAKVDNIPVLIFDEIDTGIGGETVIRVAEKLSKISKDVQIVCISHSAQIAGKAKQHFYIEKNYKENKTVTNVKTLNKEERVLEIARMLAGDKVSEAVLKHAKELLKED